MNKLARTSLFFGIFLPIHLLSAAFVPTEDGIYAQFSVSHDGVDYEFTANLHYEKVPMTVLNFMELAEGTKKWAEFGSLEESEAPFYDGLTFHRIVPESVVQAGSRNGMGNDGPGYQFPDDMDTSLTHSEAGVLSMANSGTNTNGSQFFITLAEAPVLDGKHSIFGMIVDGLADVLDLGVLPADEDGKPESTVVINSVTIIRVGADANNFTGASEIRPQLRRLLEPEFIMDAGPSYTIRIPGRDSSYGYQVYGTPDLQNTWGTLASAAPDFSEDGDTDLDATEFVAANGKYFFTVAESEVGSRVDGTGLDYTFTLDESAPIVLNLTSPTSGSYTFGDSSGSLNFYQLYDLGDRYQLYFDAPGIFPIQVYFDKDATSGDAFAHVIGNEGEFNLDGTFTSP